MPALRLITSAIPASRQHTLTGSLLRLTAEIFSICEALPLTGKYAYISEQYTAAFNMEHIVDGVDHDISADLKFTASAIVMRGERLHEELRFRRLMNRNA
jgi:hypothetical protein